MATFNAFIAMASIVTAIAIIRQTSLMRNQLVSTLGAVLRLDSSIEPAGLLIALANFHDAVATNIRVRVTMAQRSFPGNRPLAKTVDTDLYSPVIARDKGFSAIIPKPKSLEVYHNNENEPWPGEVVYEYRFEYSYKNGFDELISESSCFIWTPVIQYVRDSGPDVGNHTVGGLISCDVFESSVDTIRDLIKGAPILKN